MNKISKAFRIMLIVCIVFSGICTSNVYAASQGAELPSCVENAYEDNNTNSTRTIGCCVGGAYISDENYIDVNDSFEETDDECMLLATGWYSLPGTTYRYEQSDPYYCVPATMQTILRYNNNSTPPSQDSIATSMGFQSGLGVDFLNVPSFLNSNQTKRTYVMHTKSFKSTMCSKIKSDINTYVVPTSIRIQVSDASDWFYVTGGHALVCNSIMTDNSTVQLVDPGVGYSWYDKSTTDLFKVFTHLAW